MVTQDVLDVDAPRRFPASTEEGAEGSVRVASVVLAVDIDAATGPEAAAGPKVGGEAAPLLDVRPVSVRDLPSLRRLGPVFRFDQPDAQLAPYSLLRAGLSAAMPGGRRRRRPVFVARSGDRLVGYAEFRPISPDQRWLLLAIGGAAGGAGEPVWDALLRHGVIGAGLGGSRRLYARVPSGAPVVAALRRGGWTPYATETIFSAYNLVAPGAPCRLRRQRPADTWAIHQLYNAAVPRPVQEAEAFTSHRWDVPPGAVRRGIRIDGWLLEEGHHLLGYARATTRDGTSVLELIHHPERRDVLADLIGGALAALPSRPARRVYCPVRAYQAEVASRLEEHGFAPSLEQELLVRYTTAQMRSPAFDAVPFHVEVRDKLPQRVPTFLRGEVGDGPTR